MKNHAPVALTGAVALGLLLSGCSGDGTPSTSATGAQPPASLSQPSDDPTASKAPTDDSNGTASAGGAVDEIRDGSWQVGDAGEVEFAFDGGTLSLTEIRPAEGWEHRISDEKPDEIEVHFTSGAQEWKFEVETENDGLEISKELKIRGGQSGDFTIGSAATVSFSTDGSTVSVSNVQPADGWSITKQDEDADEVEIEFRNADGNGKAEFEAELERDGVKIEISQKLAGPVT